MFIHPLHICGQSTVKTHGSTCCHTSEPPPHLFSSYTLQICLWLHKYEVHQGNIVCFNGKSINCTNMCKTNNVVVVVVVMFHLLRNQDWGSLIAYQVVFKNIQLSQLMFAKICMNSNSHSEMNNFCFCFINQSVVWCYKGQPVLPQIFAACLCSRMQPNLPFCLCTLFPL